MDWVGSRNYYIPGRFPEDYNQTIDILTQFPYNTDWKADTYILSKNL